MKNNRIFLVSSLVIVLFSCSREISCTKEYKDSRFIDEFLVIKDTCNIFQNYMFESYFLNDTIVMEGYGDRVIKQGHWTYFNKGKKVTHGDYKDSSPLGTWNYNEFQTITWESYQNNKGQYRINIPNNWIVYDKYVNAISIVNDTIPNNFKIKVDVEIGTINEPFEDWVIGLKDELKNDKNSYNVKFKKLNLFDIPNSLQIEFTRGFDDFGVFKVNQINIEFNGKIYMIIISVKMDSNYSYEIIMEQIMRSFKFIKFEGE